MIFCRLILLVLVVAVSKPNDSLPKSDSFEITPRPVRIGLALSGGAALGFAHIGVLKVLDSVGIPIVGISGNSMGSLVGGVYAAGYSPTVMESLAVNADWSKLFSSNPSFGSQYLPERRQSQRYIIQLRHRNFFPALPSGLISLQNVEFLLMQLLAEIEYHTNYNFDSLPIPYRAVAVDLLTGQKKIIKNGRLAQAIRASIAIPGVFAPEDFAGEQLVDGGLQQYLPVDPLLEFKPDFIIAVLTMKHSQAGGNSLIDVVSRTIDVVGIEDLKRQKQLADILIEPNVDKFLHSDFARARELIAVGESAARTILPEIYKKLAGCKPVSVHKKIIPKPLPLVHSIRFEGLRITHPRLLISEIRTRPGSYLDFKRLINDLNRIFNTGLFESVNYRLEFTGQDWVDIIIKVKERAYGFYSLGVRYDNADNLGLGLEFGQGNLGGSGASLRGVMQLGNPNEYRLGLTGTRLFRLPFGYRLDGFWRSVEHSYWRDGVWQADYNTIHRGSVVEAGYILGRDAYFNIGLKGYEARYLMPPLAIFDSIPEKEWTIGPSFLLEFNNCNDLFLPGRGLIYRFDFYLANKKFKSDKEFIKINFSMERIAPLTTWWLWRYGFELGMTRGELPWSECFRSGGENLVGFAKDEFTTKDKAIIRLGTEFRLFRLFNRDDYPFYFQLLSNLATFQRLNQFTDALKLDSVLNWGFGLGIRTNTPIGPFQLIFGVADLIKSSSMIRGNFLISVGRDFRYFPN
ncbi:MAG: patatin-like phospholipase family protein [candidate division WOR-3 bacterium]